MTVWILEDEQAAAQELQEFLRLRCAFAESCVDVRGLEDAARQLARRPGEVPDVLLADIMLEGESGIDAAGALLARLPALYVIFLTGSHEASMDIYARMQPYAVLFKDCDYRERLLHYLGQIAAAMDAAARRLCFNAQGKQEELPLREILWLESRKNHIYMHTDSEIFMLREKLDALAGRLDSRFARCHQSFAVNLDRVTRMEENDFILEGGAMVPISRAHKQEAVRAFHLWKGGAPRGA